MQASRFKQLVKLLDVIELGSIALAQEERLPDDSDELTRMQAYGIAADCWVFLFNKNSGISKAEFDAADRIREVR